MANSAGVKSGQIARLLGPSFDKLITHFEQGYPIIGDQIFQSVDIDKAYYEAVQLAGMGLAGLKGESAPITLDSVDQDWRYTWQINTYEKSSRISMEAIRDNQHEATMPLVAEAMLKALKHTRDENMAAVLNNAFTAGNYVGPDGQALLSTAHPLQAGGTSANTLTTNLDLSEDAIEQALITIDGILTPDGLKSDYNPKTLVIPKELKFEAIRQLQGKERPNTANREISAINKMGLLQDYIMWKRLYTTNAWFITTDAPNCLLFAKRQGIEKRMFNDENTYDVVVTAFERYRAFFADWRGIFGSY
jgi:hypothetical protein